eukprot:CAMPEP_0182427964 /NCGR_PEP_ID=MMETSP1167-20130531/20923_1 /TAXON_ID=2988 /ORGANISM="Mallomonas Sp, Strain CCMP3275" /LENGTH=91 /DNA_ID=CAMNT_0024610575 /DNA_START=105 /DNA_END=380 /DNA_ORIENTATION=-
MKVSQRMMSGSAEHAKAEMDQWYKLTIGMVALCGVVTVYNLVAHSHDHAHTGLPYQKIRNKPYPWSCPDCNLLDYPCWDECKGRGSAKADH